MGLRSVPLCDGWQEFSGHAAFQDAGRGARIVRVRTRTLTAFTGTSITGLTLDVGESNTPTDSKWVTAGADIMAANTEVLTDVAADRVLEITKGRAG